MGQRNFRSFLRVREHLSARARGLRRRLGEHPGEKGAAGSGQLLGERYSVLKDGASQAVVGSLRTRPQSSAASGTWGVRPRAKACDPRLDTTWGLRWAGREAAEGRQPAGRTWSSASLAAGERSRPLCTSAGGPLSPGCEPACRRQGGPVSGERLRQTLLSPAPWPGASRSGGG